MCLQLIFTPNISLAQNACSLFFVNEDFSLFEKTRARFVSEFETTQSDQYQLTLADPPTRNEILGFLAALEARGTVWSYDFNRFFQDVEKGERKKQEYLVEQLAKLLNGNSLSHRQVYKIAELMYFMSNSPSSAFARYEDLEIRGSDLLEQRFTKEITTHTLFGSLKKLGFIRDPKVLERLRLQAYQSKEYLKMAFAAALIVLPVSLLNAKQMDQITFQRIYKIYLDSGGKFDSIHDEVQSYYGKKRTGFDLVWMWMSKVYASVALSMMITVTLTQGIPTVIKEGPNFIREVPTVASHIAQFRVPLLLNRFGLFHLSNKQEIQERLFGDWLDAQKYFGQTLKPTDPEYIKKHDEIFHYADIELYFRNLNKE